MSAMVLEGAMLEIVPRRLLWCLISALSACTASIDASFDGSADAHVDAARDGSTLDGAFEGGVDASFDAPPDGSLEGGLDASLDAAPDGTLEGGVDASFDGSVIVCGDGVVAGIELCDDGPSNSDSRPDACRTDCTLPRCGDRVVDAGEEVDPPVSPSVVVHVDPVTCRYDFSDVRQLSCNGTCGSWGGGAGCQQEDADALCKLVTGNPASVATGALVTSVLPASGICCPPPTAPPGTLGCVHLGDMTGRGVPKDVSIHDTNMSVTHGTGSVILIDGPEDCTDPD